MKTNTRFVLIFLIAFIVIPTIIMYTTLVRDIGYLTRPLWDTPISPFNIIPHYNSLSCEVHGWTNRTIPRKVYDIVPFSIELDILELRLLELWDVVDYFIVVESNSTFVGNPKELTLKDNIEQFNWASSKLVYRTVYHYREPGESAFGNEGKMRIAIRDAARKMGIQSGDIVINSNVNEIPNRDTVELFKSCDGIPDITHLEMKSYIYSFEFPIIDKVWRPSIKVYTPDTDYTHSRQSDWLFAGAGWHCSFCFPKVEDFIFKMTSYSHYDRVTNKKKMLSLPYIEEKVCSGKDIFNMYPEAFNYKDLIYSLGSQSKNSDFSDLPQALTSSKDFSFLIKRCHNSHFVQ
ncbi:unnamed protein product [Cunninghamella blakesleeana]